MAFFSSAIVLLSSRKGANKANKNPPQAKKLKDMFPVSQAPAFALKIKHLTSMSKPVQQSKARTESPRSSAQPLKPLLEVITIEAFS